MLKQTAQDFNAGRMRTPHSPPRARSGLPGWAPRSSRRDWARNDAGHVFRALVKEGASVESRAIRVIGKQLDPSIATATSRGTKARTTALTAVNAFGGLVRRRSRRVAQFRARGSQSAREPRRKRSR